MMGRSVFMQTAQAVYKRSEIIVKNARWGSITIHQGRNNKGLNAGSLTESKKEWKASRAISRI